MDANDVSQILNTVAQTLSGPAKGAVAAYGVWFVARATALIVLGLAMVAYAFFGKLEAFKDQDEISACVIRGALAIVGALFVAVNVGDVASPEAIAIHQLLNDIKP